MRLFVRDILAEEIGYSRAYSIEGERPEFENVTLAAPINGDLTVTKLQANLMARGGIETTVVLQCHRCLESYEKPVELRLEQVYSKDPGDDQMPIENDEIDLAPLIEQELLLAQPIKLLCREDCQGVPGTKEYLKVEPDTEGAKSHNKTYEG